MARAEIRQALDVLDHVPALRPVRAPPPVERGLDRRRPGTVSGSRGLVTRARAFTSTMSRDYTPAEGAAIVHALEDAAVAYAKARAASAKRDKIAHEASTARRFEEDVETPAWEARRAKLEAFDRLVEASKAHVEWLRWKTED